MATRNFVWPDLDAFVRMAVRADHEGIVLRPIPRLESLCAATSSQGDRTYLVSERSCTCPAGQHGHLCKHRALAIVQNLRRLVDEYGPPPWSVVDGVVVDDRVTQPRGEDKSGETPNGASQAA